MTTRPATIETVQLVVSRGLVSWLGRGSVRLVIVFRGGDHSWLSREKTNHGRQGRTPAIVVRGGHLLLWSGKERSHGGQRRRPVMVVIGDQSW